MMRILLAMAAVVAAFAVQQRPAQAAEAPWCLISQGGGSGRCTYNSIEACRQDMVGGGSFCNPNPNYQGAQPRQQAPRRRRY
jgi:hypothetical protein